MPRIPVRVEPYSSPQRRQRHFKNKRDQILRALGKASYINGSQFAILWVNSRGESEVYASECFQSRLPNWFGGEVIKEARELVLANPPPRVSPEPLQPGTDASNGSGPDAHEDSPDELADDDDQVPSSITSWQQAQFQQEHDGNRASQGPVFYVSQFDHHKHANSFLSGSGSVKNALEPYPGFTGQEGPNRGADMQSARRGGGQHDRLPDQINGVPTPLGSVTTMSAASSSAPCESGHGDLRAIVIGNTEEVAAFFETRLRQLQQLVCKIVAKAWIKVIEPKKQTRFPYNRGEESKPIWWPLNVRHKEPDHLMKPERISLLMTMLRSAKVPINRLELATAEVAAFIPPDKINLLREIYRVAREEERLRNNEISPKTKVFVAASTASIIGPANLNASANADLATDANTSIYAARSNVDTRAYALPISDVRPYTPASAAFECEGPRSAPPFETFSHRAAVPRIEDTQRQQQSQFYSSFGSGYSHHQNSSMLGMNDGTGYNDALRASHSYQQPQAHLSQQTQQYCPDVNRRGASIIPPGHQQLTPDDEDRPSSPFPPGMLGIPTMWRPSDSRKSYEQQEQRLSPTQARQAMVIAAHQEQQRRQSIAAIQSMMMANDSNTGGVGGTTMSANCANENMQAQNRTETSQMMQPLHVGGHRHSLSHHPLLAQHLAQRAAHTDR